MILRRATGFGVPSLTMARLRCLIWPSGRPGICPVEWSVVRGAETTGSRLTVRHRLKSVFEHPERPSDSTLRDGHPAVKWTTVASIAQLVEQVLRKDKVGGSSPS